MNLYFTNWDVIVLCVVPVGERVDAFPDAVRVDVVLADQTLTSLDHSFDSVQV